MKLSINNTELFYVTEGTGNPFILLHGNGEDQTIFSALIMRLSQVYTVYAIDSRSHGQSAKSENFSYEVMAEDIVAFIKELKLETPILFGFSDGGIIGTLIAIKHPFLLQKLIVSGININPRGLKPYLLSYYYINYLFTKDPLIKLMLEDPNINKEQLHKIIIPVYLLTGTKDVIRRKHTLYINKNIKGSKLIIVAHATHDSYVFDNDELYQLLIPILNQ